MRDILRRVEIGLSDGTYMLEMWDTGRMDGPRSFLGYAFFGPDGTEIFSGDDFSPSPLDGIDSDASVRALLGFLSLRPGDTDADYFDSYTPAQFEWAQAHGEELSLYADEDAPFIDMD